MRMWKKSDRAGNSAGGAETAARRSRGLARRLGKKSLFIVFVSSAPVLLRSRLRRILGKTGGRGRRKNMGKCNRKEPGRWRLPALNNKGALRSRSFFSRMLGIPAKRSFFLSSARSGNFGKINIFCRINFEREWRWRILIKRDFLVNNFFREFRVTRRSIDIRNHLGIIEVNIKNNRKND